MQNKRFDPGKCRATTTNPCRKGLAGTLALALFIYSCTSTRMLDRTSEETYHKLNKAFSGKTVYARFANGIVYKIDYIRATPDSITFAYAQSGVRMTLPTSAISSIYLKNSKKGIKQGIIMGSLIALPLGIVAAASVDTDVEINKDPFLSPTIEHAAERSTYQMAAVGFLGIIMAGALVGALIGASGGSQDIYKLATPEEIQQTKKTPVKSGAH
jgi:hypothetical protein